LVVGKCHRSLLNAHHISFSVGSLAYCYHAPSNSGAQRSIGPLICNPGLIAGASALSKRPLRAVHKNPLKAVYKNPLKAVYKNPLKAVYKNPLKAVYKNPLKAVHKKPVGSVSA
jgi:hypothetical protein